MRCRSELLLISPPVAGGREKDLRFKLNVSVFHAGVEAGGTSIEDPPGERNGPFGKLILAYLRDPSGNKICAMHRLG